MMNDRNHYCYQKTISDKFNPSRSYMEYFIRKGPEIVAIPSQS